MDATNVPTEAEMEDDEGTDWPDFVSGNSLDIES